MSVCANRFLIGIIAVLAFCFRDTAFGTGSVLYNIPFAELVTLCLKLLRFIIIAVLAVTAHKSRLGFGRLTYVVPSAHFVRKRRDCARFKFIAVDTVAALRTRARAGRLTDYTPSTIGMSSAWNVRSAADVADSRGVGTLGVATYMTAEIANGITALTSAFTPVRECVSSIFEREGVTDAFLHNVTTEGASGIVAGRARLTKMRFGRSCVITARADALTTVSSFGKHPVHIVSERRENFISTNNAAIFADDAYSAGLGTGRSNVGVVEIVRVRNSYLVDVVIGSSANKTEAHGIINRRAAVCGDFMPIAIGVTGSGKLCFLYGYAAL